jgi:hypothetical protein
MTKTNPKGRADLALLKVAERVVRTRVEPRLGVRLWDFGLQPVAEGLIRELGVPKRNLFKSGFGRAVEAAIGGGR